MKSCLVISTYFLTLIMLIINLFHRVSHKDYRHNDNDYLRCRHDKLMDGKDNTKILTSNRLRNIKSIGLDEFVAAGDKNNEEGILFYSNDGGGKWQTMESDFPDIHRIGNSKKYVWIVGKEGFTTKRRWNNYD